MMEQIIKTLISEDEPTIAKKIQVLVQELGWIPKLTQNIPQLLEELSNAKVPYDVLVLDRMLGNSDSADYVHSIKQQYPTLRIFILSAIDSSLEKAKLIDSGADDYLAKPFDSIEFQARLKALLRRTYTSSKLNYEVANLSLDLVHRSVSINGVVLNLTAKEFLVIHTLSGSIGKIFSKSQLIECIWGFSPENETNVVESTVNSLRRKLEQAKAQIQIKNTRFVGYWIEI